MKKMIWPALGVFFLALGISACKKTTSKAQLVNDWKVTSYEEKTTTTVSDGTSSNTDVKSVSMNGTEIVTFTSFSSIKETGEVALNKLTLKRDGTWEWDQDYTIVNSSSIQVVRSQIIRKQSGTWNFMGKSKTDGFKRNERVLFNILAENRSTYQSVNGNPAYSQGSTSETYSPGQKTMTFRITSSTFREIRMESDFVSTDTDQYGTTTLESLKKITLRNR